MVVRGSAVSLREVLEAACERSAHASAYENGHCLQRRHGVAKLVEAACARARRGELSRARQLLTVAELAPGDEATRAALTDPAKRPPQHREPIPPEVLQFQPPTPRALDFCCSRSQLA